MHGVWPCEKGAVARSSFLRSPDVIRISTAAAEHLRQLLSSQPAGESVRGLRLSIEKGGCAGWQYQMKLAKQAEQDDEVIEQHGVCLMVERASLPWLQGSELDYEDSLNDAGFRLNNPNAARSCGCGTSFEPLAENPGP